jgi:hypothetical protein
MMKDHFSDILRLPMKVNGSPRGSNGVSLLSGANGGGKEDSPAESYEGSDTDRVLVEHILDAIATLKREKTSASHDRIVNKVSRVHGVDKATVEQQLRRALKSGLLFQLYLNKDGNKPSFFDPAVLRYGLHEVGLKGRGEVAKGGYSSPLRFLLLRHWAI